MIRVGWWRGATPERIGTLAAEFGIPIFETSVKNVGLEDIFLRLTNDHEEMRQ